MLNEGLSEMMWYRRKNKLNVVNLGVKIFIKNKGGQNSKLGFRLLMDGLDIMLPYMNDKRVVKISKELFYKFKEIHDHMLTFE